MHADYTSILNMVINPEVVVVGTATTTRQVMPYMNHTISTLN
jgi:hypothetical protein